VDEFVGGGGVSPGDDDDIRDNAGSVDDVDESVERVDATATSDEQRSPSPVDAASLALADYDHLPASDIVALLDGLEPSERSAIEAYERAGRHRRTVLGKLDQLRGDAE
jgi:hypothetical protein